MDLPDYEEFFSEYAKAYERSLGESVDVAVIRSFFAEAFVSARVSGQVAVGANNETFEETLRRGYSFYKAIGTTRMKIDFSRLPEERRNEGFDSVRRVVLAPATECRPKDLWVCCRRRNGCLQKAWFGGRDWSARMSGTGTPLEPTAEKARRLSGRIDKRRAR